MILGCKRKEKEKKEKKNRNKKKGGWAEKRRRGGRWRQRASLRRWLRVVPPDGPLPDFVLYPELGYPYTAEYLGLKTA